MLTRDRVEFDEHLGALCAGFNVPMTDLRAEAYWRGLQKMQLGQFARTVEYALGEDGPERIPTVPQCWMLWRKVRNHRPTQPATQAQDVAREFDAYHAFGQRCLMRFLQQRGGVPESALPRLIAEKNRLVEDFRQMAGETEVTADDVRETLLKSFARVAA